MTHNMRIGLFGLIAVSLVAAVLVVLTAQTSVVEAQLLEKLFNGITNRQTETDTSIVPPQGQQQPPTNAVGDIGSRFRKMMSVQIPVFYEMVKNGSSMGINVLSGLVNVDRGAEAEKTGLRGSRPLSVRVFGVPVYERGERVRPLNSGGGFGFNGAGGEPKPGDGVFEEPTAE